MTRAQAEIALDAKLVEPNPAADQDDCVILTAATLQGFNLMLKDGRVVRLSIWLNQKPGDREAAVMIRTAEGVGLLSTDRQVRAAYPKGLVRTPADYDDEPAHNLVFHEPTNAALGLRFEVNAHSRVVVLHAGQEPALSSIEDCL
jgi:hypothetical protein